MNHKVHTVPMRFVLPVIVETILTVATGLVFSQIVSTVSESALAATGMGDNIMNFLVGICALVSTGSAVVISQQIGAGLFKEAAQTAERATGLTILIAGGFTLVMELLSYPLMKLLMGDAEPAFFMEALRYYQIMLLSVPMQILLTVFTGVLRGMGDSRSPMIAIIVRNIAQLFFAWLLVHIFRLEMIGAALAHVLCRTIGALLAWWALKYNPRHILIRFRNMFRLGTNREMTGRILRIGMPSSFSNAAIQFGYVLMNSLAVSLGTFECSIYQLLTTLCTIVSFPQSIATAITLPVTGNLIGAKEPKKAKLTGLRILLIGLAVTLLLVAIVWLGGEWILGLYSSSEEMVQNTRSLIWLILVLQIPAMGLNTIGPQLEGGGDTKMVMAFNLISVWVFRIPLSYLFCNYFHWGVVGLFMANSINLYVRWAMVMIRWAGKRWYANHV